MSHRIQPFSALAVMLLAAASLWAHHNMSAIYDFNNRVAMSGTLTKFDWRNPHIELIVDAKGDKDQMETWTLEGPPPSFFRTRDKRLAAMTHFHHGHARALPIEQLLTSLLQDFKGQRGRPRGEIENAHEKFPFRESTRERGMLAASAPSRPAIEGFLRGPQSPGG